MEMAYGPTDILDHATPDFGAGSNIGFDATAKWPEEGKVRVRPKELAMDAATKALLERRRREYGL